MPHTILIPIEPGSISKKDLEEICAKYDCSVEQTDKDQPNYSITSENATNFFWLGANLQREISKATTKR